MAYQPKSYKKFVATAATATLVATAVVPAAFADEATTAAFTDVPASYDAAVSFLVENNFAVGLSETQFGISAQITRGDAAVVIAKAAGLMDEDAKASGFTDVPARGAIAVNSLKAAGVVNGTSTTKFGWDQPIKRGDAAIMFAKAFGLTEGSASDVDFTDVPDRYKEAVAALLANDVTNGINATQYGTDNNIKRGDFAKFVYALKDRIELPSTTPAVASVSAINAKQVVVKFATAIDVDTVITDAGTTDTLKSGVFNISRVPAATGTEIAKNVVADDATGELSADGKTLTITAAGTTYFDGTYAVTVNDTVTDVNGNEIPVFSGTLTADDNTAPTVAGVTYDVSSNLVTVEFNELLASQPTTVRQNGQPVQVLSFTNDTITFANTATAGTNSSVYVAGGVDFAGNTQTLFNGSVFVSQASTTALTVTALNQVDSNVVRVVFDKAVDGNATVAATDVANSLTVLKDGSTTTAYNVTRSASDTSNRSFDITFTGAAPSYSIYDGTATTEALTFVLADDSITDIFGNKNGLYNNALTLTKDVAGPALVSSKVSADKKTLEVTFNEKLLSGSVNDAAFTVRRDGVAQTVDTSTDIKTGAGNEAVVSIALSSTDLNTDGTLKAGTYTVRLEEGAVKDEHTNNNALISTNVVVTTGSTVATPLTATTIQNAAGVANTFEVTYSEEVTASALSASNYTLDGAALPANTDIYFKNATKTVAVIVLPANTVNIGDASTATTGTNAIFGVKNVVDTDGDVVAAKSSTVKVQDNTAASLTAARLVGDTLELTFNENLDATSTPADFDAVVAAFGISNGSVTLADGTTPGGETVATAVSGNKLTITVTDAGDSNWTSVKAAGTITVTTKSGISLEDSNNVDVKAGASVTATR